MNKGLTMNLSIRVGFSRNAFLGSNNMPEPKYKAHTKHLFDSGVELESRRKACVKRLMGFSALYEP